MTQKNHINLLVDLLPALEGHAGIPQDSRLLFKLSNNLPNITVSGLIYGNSIKSQTISVKNFSDHSFLEQIVQNANLIASFLNPKDTKYHAIPFIANIRRLKNYFRAITQKSFSLIEINNDIFYNLIWRNLLSKSLNARDYEKFLQTKFYASNINLQSLSYHASHQRTLKLDTKDFDFVIFQDQRTVQVSPNTKKIIRLHDIIPISDIDTTTATTASNNSLYFANALKLCLQDSYYVCNSEASQAALLKLAPQLQPKCFTIPCALPDFYQKKNNISFLNKILKRRLRNGIFDTSDKFEYILTLSTLEPRKNHISLIRAFEKLQAEYNTNMKLIIVGNPGWKSEPIIDAMQPLLHEGSLLHLQNLTSEELPYLYSYASAFVFPSYNEGFGLPPLEAMQCECPTIVSDIATHRSVMGDASMYCNPYDIDSITSAIYQMVCSPESENTRSYYIQKGLEQIKLYSLDSVQNKWSALLETLKQ